MILLSFVLSAPRLLAQQNGVQRSVTLAELTYGESIDAMIPDGAGGFWFGGYTCSTTLPTTSNAIQKSWSGPPCVPTGLLGRMKADGSITYLSYFGGSGPTTQITALALGPSGNLYVAGWTSAADFPTTVGAYDRTLKDADGFVAELSPDASQIVFSTYLGGTDSDKASSVAIDSSGGVHLAGTTYSTDFPVTSGALQATFHGGSDSPPDGFYARLSADGSALQYATYLGGSDYDMANGVAVDSAGNAYVVGQTGSDDFPMLNPANSQGPTTGWGGFLAKFSSSGAVYSTYAPYAKAVSVVGDFVYVSGTAISELAAATGSVSRTVDLRGADGTYAEMRSLAVDQNHTAYAAGLYEGNDADSCGPECVRYPATWDAYKRQLHFNDTDAVLSIVDFGAQTPSVLYSTMLGGTTTDLASAVVPDGAGGAFFGGYTEASGFPSVNAQAQPAKDPGADDQSFVAHVSAQTVTMPTPPADIALYAYDPNGISPTAITGDWKIVQDSTAAGGWAVHEPDQGRAKVTTPAADPQNYFELEFLADASVPYHLWLRMKADNDSYQNDSVWVQFSDSIDGGGNPVWRIGSNDATPVSLEDCSGCGEQGWGWNDNGYGVPGTPVYFATSGWHTIRIQQREDGISIDQIVLSSNQWANTAPGANRNDATILPQSFAQPSSAAGDMPPTVSITGPLAGTAYSPGATIAITATAADSDGSVSKVDFYENGSLIGTSATAPYSVTWNNVPAGRYTVAAIATDNEGATTISAPVGVAVFAEPGLGRDADVGATGAPGFAERAPSGGPITIYGAGADVWGTSDAFQYMYSPLSGDGTIAVKVTNVSNQSNWVKAGLMIRGSLDPSSAQAFMLVSFSKGVAFQRRTVDGGASTSTAGPAVTAPYWVKLVRSGSIIYGYASADGANWTLVGSDSFNMPQTVYVGLAVSSHVYGTLASATFQQIEIGGGVTLGDADIGNVPFAGSTSSTNGTWSITASGADIWDTADAFHYRYQFLDGDGAIVAHVASIQNVSPWVKAGVMIRETLDPDSAHAFMLVSASKGVAFQRRDATGGTSVNTAGSASTAPHWVKLVRKGNTFTGYESVDGTNWTLVGSDTIPMASAAYIGLAVTSHNTSSSTTVTFDDWNFHSQQ
ncbi:MAG: SBBP repeat-containing protein [Vicinamibacterales bacterium]